MAWALLAAFALASFVGVWAGTGLVLRLLRRHHILDHPSPRSSHTVPTPRGGGLAIVAVVTIAGLLAAGVVSPGALSDTWPVFAAALALAAISWIDDLRRLPPLVRLAAQVVAVAAGLFALPGEAPVFQGLLPPWLDRLAAAVAWLWFVNLFNFMDGIDGISASEAASVGVGLCLVGLAAGGADAPILYAAVIAGAALGFLPWNWEPARIFMGDVGSVTLGYLLGWLLLWAAALGLWPAALLLPLYYLADATATLARRLVRGERVWEAHREHFYQLAVRRGLSHGTVVRAVVAANLGLVALALLSLTGPTFVWLSLAAGAMCVAGLLWYLRGTQPERTHG